MLGKRKNKRRANRQRERDVEPGAPLHPDAADPRDNEPHHALTNPASDPDSTEFPDPYERRPDPRGPRDLTPAVSGDEEAKETDEDGTPRPPSTSEPHPPHSYDELKPVKGKR